MSGDPSFDAWPQEEPSPRKDSAISPALIAVIVVGIVGLATFALVLPALMAVSEQSRRVKCANNLKQLGLAFHNYHATNNCLPAGADWITSANGGAKTPGFSFLVQLLPFMEYDPLYRTLQVRGGDPDDPNKPSHTVARNTLIPWFVCDSNQNPKFVNPTSEQGALTNYKGMGATHMDSLLAQLDPSAVPAYGRKDMHPDGAIFMGKANTFRDFGDGTAHTILCVETIDAKASIWTRGSDVMLVGLPVQGTTAGTPQYQNNPQSGVVTFERSGNFFAPTGFNGGFDHEASSQVRNMRTFLDYDFAKKEAGLYPGIQVNSPAGRWANKPAYGPSSGHPAVVNHLFVDASVRPLSKHIDAAAYMFLITRNGGDPFPRDLP